MLEVLHIENIAVIAQADLTLGRGLHALTGETGAGKSIIIDAIGALMGERTSRDIIRTGEKFAFVSGVFSHVSQAVTDTIESLGVTPEEDGTVSVSRRVYADGRNLCHINGAPVALGAVRTLGATLCKSLGQQDNRTLLDVASHLPILDVYAGTVALREEYETNLARLKSIRKEQKTLLEQAQTLERQRELLRWQVEEIGSAAPVEGEDEALATQRALMRASEKIAGALEDAAAWLRDEEDSAFQRAENALRALTGLQTEDRELSELCDRLAEAVSLLRDCTDTVLSLNDRYTFSEEERNAIEERNDLLKTLKNKYGGSIPAVLAFYEKAKEELEALEDHENRTEALAQAYNEQYQVTMELARALSQKRKSAAEALSEAVCEELTYLCMPGTRFSVHFSEKTREGRTVFGADGIDNVEFYISANRGESERPLAKTASGGELSRLMLAVNSVQNVETADTLIFDEIDAGISGIAATRVANRLWTIARERQVLCVTHLSQLAVVADHHLRIAKSAKGERTFTEVTALDFDGRVEEIARINSGENVTDATRAAAAEQLRRGIEPSENR